MKDITVVMLTANKVPNEWAKFHKEKLLEVIGDTPLITVSFKPLGWGKNIIQTEYKTSNIFRQMLRAFEMATTEWVAIADDDTLYPPGHFQYRGKTEGFYYNYHRWQLATWKPEFYFYKPKPGNGCMIATRTLAIEKIKERFKIDPDLSGKNHCKELGTWNRWTGFDEPKHSFFFTEYGIVTFYHDFSHDQYSRHHNKLIYPVRANEIPHWGRSENVYKKFA